MFLSANISDNPANPDGRRWIQLAPDRSWATLVSNPSEATNLNFREVDYWSEVYSRAYGIVRCESPQPQHRNPNQ